MAKTCLFHFNVTSTSRTTPPTPPTDLFGSLATGAADVVVVGLEDGFVVMLFGNGDMNHEWGSDQEE